MRKIIALLLALVMCLSLTACASEDEKAFEAANKLFDAGDWEGALEAYRSIPLYQQIIEKIIAAETHLRTEDTGFLTGLWKDLKNEGYTLEFHDDGTCTVTYTDDTYDMDVYLSENGEVEVMGGLEVKEIDGVTHLTDNDYYDYVPAANYDDLCAKKIEITMDNWDTYFELREASQVYTNDFGEVSSSSFGYGVFLKEEYIPKLFNEYNAVDVSFKMRYDQVHRYVVGDYPDGEFSLGAQFKQRYYTYETKEDTASVSGYFYEGYSSHVMNSFKDVYAADFCSGYVVDYDGKVYACVPIDVEITAVVGTLYLFP